MIYTPHDAVTSCEGWRVSILSMILRERREIRVSSVLAYLENRYEAMRVYRGSHYFEPRWQIFFASLEWDLQTNHGVSAADLARLK